MTASFERADILRLRAIVARRLGIAYDESRLDVLADALRASLDAAGSTPARFLQRLASPASGRDELRSIAARLSVPETYFLRYENQFRAFAEVVLPDRARARADTRQLRILSAGCASGDEAYSVAITVRERLPDLAEWKVTIVGIDMNSEALEKAARARYTTWSLRETSDSVRDRYFAADGRDYVLDPAIRAMVTFEERNLLDDDPLFWQPASFDVIFCRNVTMYFVPEAARSVIARIEGALVPDGYLFLGHAETLRGVSQAFHLRHTHETFYYQRRGGAEGAFGVLRASDTDAPRLAPAVEIGDSWVATIKGASDRIAALARDPSRREGASLAAVAPIARADLGPALALLGQERFTEALAALRDLPSDLRLGPDALLLGAVLLTNRGDLAEAEGLCRQLLERDEFNADAHYLLALCRDHAGDPLGATECDRTALYLDPCFAMARLHLGLVARRSGEFATARVELGLALDLLQREEPSRVLLFGGGFSRETLVRLCRAELEATEGAR